MAGRKKKAAKKAAKRPVKKTASRKAVSRKAKPAVKAKAKTKAKAKKSLFAKAVGTVTGLLSGGKKKPAAREYGEGNYKASKRFRTEQESFVKKNKAKIPALGKAAEDALEGPEGDDLRAAEASAAGHAKD